MKHLKKGRKFGRIKKQRVALFKIQIGNLLTKGRIQTTLAKAKELKSMAEKIITDTKKPQAVRRLQPKLPKNVDAKLIADIAKRTSSRTSGYLRIIKKGARRSDGAQMAVIEILNDAAPKEAEKKT